MSKTPTRKSPRLSKDSGIVQNSILAAHLLHPYWNQSLLTKRKRAPPTGAIAYDTNCDENIELDDEISPYREKMKSNEPVKEKCVLVTEKDGQKVHEYVTGDCTGTYHDNYVSGTRLVAYSKHRGTLAHEDAENPVLHAQTACKGGFIGGAGSPRRFSTTLIAYANAIARSPATTLPEDGTAPLTYFQRKVLMKSLDKTARDDPTGFISSVVFVEFEEWVIARNKKAPSGGAPMRFISLLHVACGETFDYLDDTTRDFFKEAMAETPSAPPRLVGPVEAGTMAHLYLEARTKHGLSAQAARERYPCQEPSDYEQIEAFLAAGALEVVDSEVALCSFRHKICGTIDGVGKLPSGELILFDLKRTVEWKDDVWFLESGNGTVATPRLDAHAPSSCLVGYATQMAIYRRLYALNGRPPLAPTAILVVINPIFDAFRLIKLDLTQRMRIDHGGFYNHVDIPRNGRCSPISLAEALFSLRLGDVQSILPVRTLAPVRPLAPGPESAENSTEENTKELHDGNRQE